MVVTCPEVGCRFNGFGECQLGQVAETILIGVPISQDDCPYFEPAEDSRMRQV